MATLIVLESAPRLIEPIALLLPELVMRLPPLITMGSATRSTFLRSSVPALSTVVLPAVLPNAALLATTSVPALIFVEPE